MGREQIPLRIDGLGRAPSPSATDRPRRRRDERKAVVPMPMSPSPSTPASPRGIVRAAHHDAPGCPAEDRHTSGQDLPRNPPFAATRLARAAHSSSVPRGDVAPQMPARKMAAHLRTLEQPLPYPSLAPPGPPNSPGPLSTPWCTHPSTVTSLTVYEYHGILGRAVLVYPHAPILVSEAGRSSSPHQCPAHQQSRLSWRRAGRFRHTSTA